MPGSAVAAGYSTEMASMSNSRARCLRSARSSRTLGRELEGAQQGEEKNTRAAMMTSHHRTVCRRHLRALAGHRGIQRLERLSSQA